ncbi:MAG: alpha/beta fold hydrolase [Deltaproteobacteria bacterium]|nr:alpha/beta fold hydrolase [Deltaproteobacteria bacterium]
MTARLFVEVAGKPENPALAMLHGFMGRASSLAPLIDRLSEDFYVAAFDLPGHGRSRFSSWGEAACPKTFFDAADMVLCGLDVLNIGRFSLYGYSMGGRLAQAVCIRAPKRVERLVLESASFGIADALERERRYNSDLALLSGVKSPQEFRAFLIRWHESPLFCTLRATSVLAGLIAEKLENDPEELRRALALLSVGNHPHFLPLLSALPTPVSFLYGEDDAKYKNEVVSASKFLDRLILNSFADASHDVHSQYPALAAQAIAGTL